MILQSITLENFRQFNGIQKIDFASDSGNNVTVIFGENGRGKTGLFRAIIYCLFGEKLLSQDGDIPVNEIKLINLFTLQNNQSSAVKSSVELNFIHRDSRYTLKRAMQGILEEGIVHEEDIEKKLSITYPEGNTKFIPSEDIDAEINKVLDRRVKDYFLFDGEKIEKLTRSNFEQKREIGEGIRNLLDIDIVEKSIRVLNKISKNYDQELSSSENVDLARTINLINEYEDNQSKIKKRLNEIAGELDKARRERDKTDEELRKFEEIRHLVERRKELESRKVLNDQTIDNINKEIPKIICKTSVLMIAPSIIHIFDSIDLQRQKGEIPSEIKKDLIEKILNEQRCICGTILEKNSKVEKNILEWLKRTTASEVQDGILNLWRYLSEIKNHFSDDALKVESLLQNYVNTNNDTSNIQNSLNNISEQIGLQERQDANKLNEHRKKIDDKITSLSGEESKLNDELENLKEELTGLNIKLSELKKQVSLNDEITQRTMLVRDVKNALVDIHLSFTDDIKKRISNSATELFHQLIDSETKNNFFRIVVNDDYSLDILDRYRKPFLANISAGQRQIMSISFITALAKAASRSGYIDFPLFMDTPFGRLSFDHRNNLITHIPNLTSQWILLATDTEFRKEEARLLLKTKKWDKFYILKATKEGNTEIISHDVDTAITFLNDEVN